MKSQIRQTLACALLPVLLAGFSTGCKCCWKKPCPGPIILTQPISQIASKDSPVTLSVDAKNPSPYQSDPLEYQWYFNFAPIAGEKSQTLTINKVQPKNAGRYFAIVSGYGSAKSCDADILVNIPIPISPDGNGGALAIGISSFSIGSGNSCFPNPPWNRYYAITNGNFVGPDPSVKNTLPFPNNPGGAGFSTVTIDTCDTANVGLETGIVIVRTTNPLGDKVCSPPSGSACTGPGMSTLRSNQRSVIGTNKYKATIVYKHLSGGDPANVVVNWHYP